MCGKDIDLQAKVCIRQKTHLYEQRSIVWDNILSIEATN